MTNSAPAQFSKAEPVVTAAAGTSLAVILTVAVLELLEAFDVALTTRQVGAIVGLVTVLVAITAALVARRKVSPSWKDAAIDVLVAEQPVDEAPPAV